MTAIAARLRTKLDELPFKERAALAHHLIQSLDQGVDADAHQAWDAELARRARDIKSGRAKGEPAEKVFRELRAKYS